jgi:hypothetical protein
MKKNIFSFTLCLASIVAPVAVPAMSIDWTGVYRFELVQIDKPSLAANNPLRKSYGLNYLGLGSKIIASDGVEIGMKFDVLANQDTAYTNSQLGQLWGGNPTVAGPAPTNSSTLSQSKSPTGMNVRELYLNVNQEYGSLLVGRAPYEFGLGMTWSAGQGAFDHWTTNSDLIAYKFIVGNLSFMPMIARVSSLDSSLGNTVQDERFQFSYDNEESGSTLAAVISRRKSSQGSNDIIAGTTGTLGTTAVSKSDGYSIQTSAFHLARTWTSFEFRMEAAFTSGTYGVKTVATSEDVKNNSYGIALEMDFPRPEASWDVGIKAGIASGDNPTTTDIEGFAFHKNYDVAFLLFNHRLGQKDFLGTSYLRETATHNASNSFDDEMISNAMYFAPRVRYTWNEKIDIFNTVTYAQLVTNPTSSLDFKKDLGLEWDIEAVYKPRSNIRWINQIGFLFPGGAFKDGATGLENGFNFGFTTRAAITF